MPVTESVQVGYLFEMDMISYMRVTNLIQNTCYRGILMSAFDFSKRKDTTENQVAIIEHLKGIIAGNFGIPEVEIVPNALLIDLCVDIPDYRDLINIIEKRFSTTSHQIKITDEDDKRITTLQDLVDYLVNEGVNSTTLALLPRKMEKIARDFTPLTINQTSNRWQVGFKLENRYEIRQVLGGPGNSGMGIVYVCYDHEDRVPVAIKTLQDKFLCNQNMVNRFKWEAEAWVRLEKHFNIVQAFYVKEIEGRPCVEMEYVHGSNLFGNDLGGWIREGGLTFPTTLNFAIQFCRGMIHAETKFNEMGRVFVHRDIKPSNILITSDNVVKVSDFGLVIAVTAFDDDIATINFEGVDQKFGASKIGIICGTPPYMSPEQCKGTLLVDQRSDIYSFGCVLHEMIAGKPPFQARTMNEYIKHHLKTHPKPPDTQEWLKRVIMKCLEKDPGKRYQNFGELESILSESYLRLTGKTVQQPERTRLDAWEVNNKGLSLSHLGFYKETISCMKKAIILDPQNSDYHNNLGTIYADHGNHENAISEYLESLKIDANNAMAHCNLGNEYANIRNYEAAIIEYKKSLQIDPKAVIAIINMGVTFDTLNDFHAAIDLYKTALQIDPNNDDIYCFLGIAYHHLKDLDSALEELNEALRINPRNAKAHATIARVYFEQWRVVRAERHYKMSLSIKPDDPDVHCGLGLLYQTEQARLKEAQEEYRQALEINPNHAYAHYLWGTAYRLAFDTTKDTKYLKAAASQFNEAVRIDPKNAKWLKELSDVNNTLLNYHALTDEIQE
jgi:tetratricopeptide (TPR) repeat protein/acyl carrier protein